MEPFLYLVEMTLEINFFENSSLDNWVLEIQVFQSFQEISQMQKEVFISLLETLSNLISFLTVQQIKNFVQWNQ
jgi:hypothetical protein